MVLSVCGIFDQNRLRVARAPKASGSGAGQAGLVLFPFAAKE